MPYETCPPRLDGGDDCGSLRVTNLVDLHFEVHVFMAIREGVDAIREDVALVIECTQTSFQVL